MIRRDCFTAEWIDKVSRELRYPDKNLIEKVIRAFALVEMLVASGCDFIWKGGTSLMLILGHSLHRLSIDVDIICPPGTDIEGYLDKFREYGFISREVESREQLATHIPKSHSKFHYQIAYMSGSEREEFILLDVLYEDVHYRHVTAMPVVCPFIALDSAPAMVRVPSPEDILGDKLTAFAPNTSGIPYEKNGRSRSLEIIKQLYDIGRLFDVMTDFETVRQSYSRIVPVELAYRSLEERPSLALMDTIATAECLLTRGKAGMGQFDTLQNGINRIKNFMYKEKYYIEQASADAAKAAYLAAAIMCGANGIEKYQGAESVSRSPIKVHSTIGKMYIANPEAYFYWTKAAELLAQGQLPE